MEAIGHVRHKNLVRLLGYCVEGVHRYDANLFFNAGEYYISYTLVGKLGFRPSYYPLCKNTLFFWLFFKNISPISLLICRLLVYEYVNNGNLEQWLHGALRQHGILTWEARMKVVLGTAKA